MNSKDCLTSLLLHIQVQYITSNCFDKCVYLAQVITSSSAVSATVNQDEMTIVHRKDSTVSSEFVSVSDTSDSSFEKPEKDNVSSHNVNLVCVFQSHEQVPTSLTKDRPPSAISEDHPPPPLPTSLPPTEDERTVLRQVPILIEPSVGVIFHLFQPINIH